MELIKLFKFVGDRLLQMGFSILSGLFLAFEATTVLFFAPCLIVLIIDIISAIALSRRVAKKYPDRADGKFRSSYKTRVLLTLLLVMLGVICAHYIDRIYFGGGIWTQLFVMGMFLGYEGWSIGENWSSENDNGLAKVFQLVMVNKAERHLNMPEGSLKEILIKEDVEQTKEIDNDEK